MTKTELLRFISGLSDSGRVISGQHVCWHIRDVERCYQEYVIALYDLTDQWVAIVGLPLGKTTTSAEVEVGLRVIIDHWNAGGLVQIEFMPANPWTGGTEHDLTRRNLTELVTPGSDIYNQWIDQLGELAVGLKQLQAAGIVILFRPFMEMNYRKAYWWDLGAHDGNPKPFIDLWQQLYDYLFAAGLADNLIWIYAPANYNGIYNPVVGQYPGDAYVDITGLSLYSDTGVIRDDGYRDLVEIVGKPFACAEAGPGATRDGTWDATTILDAIKNNCPLATYFQFWHSWPDNQMAIVDQARAVDLMNDPLVLTCTDIGIAFPTAYTHISTLKSGTGIIVATETSEAHISYDEVGQYENPFSLKKEIRRQAGRVANFHLHVNDNGSMAVATGERPEVWPEDG